MTSTHPLNRAVLIERLTLELKMTLDITLNLPELLALIATTASVPTLKATIENEKSRCGGKKKPRLKVINTCRKTIERLSRTFTPPPPPKHWDDRTLYLEDFLEQGVREAYDLSANIRKDVKTTKYKSNIVASALHDGNIAPSDWTPTGRFLPTGQPILQSEDGRQRTEALVQFIQNKYPFVYNARFAAPWLAQYDGLSFSMLPADAQRRVEKIQLRLRIASTPFTPLEHCRYFDARQQTSVTTPGERLTATASLNWALPMYKRLREKMIQHNLSRAKQKRGEDMVCFIRLARAVLARDEELSALDQDLTEWVDGSTGAELDQLIGWQINHELGRPEDEVDEILSTAFANIFRLSRSFVAPNGSGLKPADKKLHYLCGPILRHPARDAIIAELQKQPFTIAPEFVKAGRGWEFVNSTLLLQHVINHCEALVRPPPPTAPPPRAPARRNLVVGDSAAAVVVGTSAISVDRSFKPTERQPRAMPQPPTDLLTPSDFTRSPSETNNAGAAVAAN